MSEKCTVCHAAVYVCDSHHDRALDPDAPAWSKSTACEGRHLRDALTDLATLRAENARLVRERQNLSDLVDTVRDQRDAEFIRAEKAEAIVEQYRAGSIAVALDKAEAEVERLRAALQAIASGNAGDKQAFDWIEFHESLKLHARAGLAPAETPDPHETVAAIVAENTPKPTSKRVLAPAETKGDAT